MLKMLRGAAAGEQVLDEPVCSRDGARCHGARLRLEFSGLDRIAQGRDTKRVKFSGEVWRCKNPPLAPVSSGPLLDQNYVTAAPIVSL